jgi:hypothetical protein
MADNQSRVFTRICSMSSFLFIGPATFKPSTLVTSTSAMMNKHTAGMLPHRPPRVITDQDQEPTGAA